MLYTVFIGKIQNGSVSEVIRLDGVSPENATGLARLMLVHGEDVDIDLHPELEEEDDGRRTIASQS